MLVKCVYAWEISLSAVSIAVADALVSICRYIYNNRGGWWWLAFCYCTLRILLRDAYVVCKQSGDTGMHCSVLVINDDRLGKHGASVDSYSHGRMRHLCHWHPHVIKKVLNSKY